MRLRNILIVVEDIEKSKKFYHDLFGLDVILDNEGNVILTEGLVLQEKTIWKNFLERDIISENNSCELYFEEKNIEAFCRKTGQALSGYKVCESFDDAQLGTEDCSFFMIWMEI